MQFVLTNAALSMAQWGISLIPNRAKLFGIKYSNWKNRHNQLIAWFVWGDRSQSKVYKA
jgi:hypothetical protein